MEYMGLSEAAKKFNVNRKTLISRLARDEKQGRPLFGSQRIGKQWAVTVEYMENWKDNRKNG